MLNQHEYNLGNNNRPNDFGRLLQEEEYRTLYSETRDLGLNTRAEASIDSTPISLVFTL